MCVFICVCRSAKPRNRPSFRHILMHLDIAAHDWLRLSESDFYQLQVCYIHSRDLRSFEIRFGRPIQFDSIQKGLANLNIFKSNWLCLLLARRKLSKRLKPLTALSGTVYRLASSMSDHTPVI